VEFDGPDQRHRLQLGLEEERDPLEGGAQPGLLKQRLLVAFGVEVIAKEALPLAPLAARTDAR